MALLGLGCDERTQESDTGGILLEVDFGTNLPFRASVNAAVASGSLVVAPTLTINSIVADPLGSTSSLMDVELESIEVRYERADGGTRLPPTYVVKTLATVPAGGSFTIAGQELMSFDQLNSPPLSDLLIENGGFDRETGLTFIRLNLFIRVFGRTLGNRSVDSVSRPHTMEFIQ
jgi:hypothetical protein